MESSKSLSSTPAGQVVDERNVVQSYFRSNGVTAGILALIAQDTYKTTTHKFKPLPHYTFFTQHDCGIRLRDLLGRPSAAGLINDEDKIVFCRPSDSYTFVNGRRDKVSYCLQVLGEGNHVYISKKASHACSYTSPPTPSTRLEVAVRVARFVQQCMKECDGGKWKLRNGDIVQFDDIILLNITHVSVGSWQPQIAYFIPA